MKYKYEIVGSGLDRSGEKFSYNGVTAILTVTNGEAKIRYKIALVISVQIESFLLYLPKINRSELVIMFKQMQNDRKTQGEQPTRDSHQENDDSTTANNMDVVDIPPAAEHQETSLLDNAIALGKKSERIFSSNVLLVGGIPATLTLHNLHKTILNIATLLNACHKFGWDLPTLETQIAGMSREQLMMFSDKKTCSFYITLPEERIFAMGGHNPFPPAFGYCSGTNDCIPFTCQAIPVPATGVSLKAGLELAIFRGVSMDDNMAQCTLALLMDRIETYYAPHLNLPPESFDVILFRRKSLGHTHTTLPLDINYVGVNVRKDPDVPMSTLQARFGLRQGPNPFSCHWIGEGYQDYPGLQVTSPSRILLDRTPVTTLSTFNVTELPMVSTVTSLILDNPSFPLHAVIIICIMKIDAVSAALHIIWGFKHHTVHIGYNLRLANGDIDIIITIDASDDPLMKEVRSCIAGTLAHFKIMKERRVCNWLDKDILKQWAAIAAKNLREDQPAISPLRVAPSAPFPDSSTQITSIIPNTAISLRAEDRPTSLIAPTAMSRLSQSYSVVPHQLSPSIENVIALAVAKEVAKHTAESRRREQVLADELDAIKSAQAQMNVTAQATAEALAINTATNQAILNTLDEIRASSKRYAPQSPPPPPRSRSMDEYVIYSTPASYAQSQGWTYTPLSSSAPPTSANSSMQTQPDNPLLQGENRVIGPPPSNE